MPPRQRQHQEEASAVSSAPCSLLDLVALGPVQELIWSGLDSEDRQQLRQTCRELRDEMERSCTSLKSKEGYLDTMRQAESLVKLSGRLPQVRALHLSCPKAIQALSLDPPPAAGALRVTRSRVAAPGPRAAYFPQLEDLSVVIHERTYKDSEPPADLFVKTLPVLTEITFEFLQLKQPAPLCLAALACCPRLKVADLYGLKQLPAFPPQLEQLTLRVQADDLDPLSTLTNLKTLTFTHCYHLVDLAPIEACTALESLKVLECFALQIWPDFECLTALRELRIDNSPGLDGWVSLIDLTALTCLAFVELDSNVEVEVLAILTQLRDLTLSSVTKVLEEEDEDDDDDDDDDWQERLTSTLTFLVGLTRLTVEGAYLDTLEWCSALTNLRCLDASDNLLQSLESLPACPQLTELNLFSNSSLTSLSGLQRCTNLTAVRLGGCMCLSSLEPFESCPMLTELQLVRCEISSLESLRCCPLLTKLYLIRCPVSSLEALESCPKLTVLNLDSCWIPSLDPLQSCPKLTELILANNHGLTSLSALQGCPMLAKLDLNRCSSVSSVEPLQGCPQLTQLILSDNSIVTSLSALQGCRKLTRLCLYRCPSISSLEPLRCCTQLSILYLGDCSPGLSLAPLEHCRKLRGLDLSGAKAASLLGLEHLSSLPDLEIRGL